ncbi:MAG: glycosyltransferase [Patescibacteria group bacterium]|nr:glycosyltransferase [Patescibacteria group bacterium]
MINFLQKYKQIIKYLIAGSAAALVDLSFLYFFTDILGIWYLISAGLALVVAFFVSFFLQKFWTFRDGNRELIYKQMGAYLAVALTNFVINLALMYILVDGLKIWYMLAQFITSGLIAIESYLVYKIFIFNGKSKFQNGKIKILIATGIYPPDIGGPATMIKALAEALKKSFDIKIITYADAHSSPDEIVRVKKSGKFLKYLIYFCKMLRLAKRADILYITETYSVGYFAYLIKKITGKKYIVRFAGDSAWETAAGAGWTNDYITDFQNIKYDGRIEKLKARRKKILVNADAVIAVSCFMSRVAKMIGVDEEKITVIYNAVDFFPAPPKRQVPLNPTLIYAGRLVRWKGVAMLIQAVQALKEKRPNIIFEILGDGPEEARLKKMVGDLGLAKNVIFRGRVSEEESHGIFARSTVFVLNSNYEGMPHSVLNAMRSGLPVITTPIDGNREVVRDGQNGLLAPYNELEAWVAAINKLLNDQGLQQTFSNNGLEIVKKFKWSEAVEKTAVLIRDLGQP